MFLHKDKDGWVVGWVWGTFILLCMLISQSQGPFPQHGRLAEVTTPQGLCCNLKLSAVRALDVSKICLQGFFFNSKTAFWFFLMLGFLSMWMCLCEYMYMCSAGEWKHREQHWWPSADLSVESSAARISERNQELCPPSATEVSDMTESVFITNTQKTLK